MQTSIPYQEPRIGGIPRRKLKFVLGGLVIALAITALIVNGVRSAGNYYITLEELAARGSQVVGDGVRVKAPVDKESVDYDTRDIELTFDLIDDQGNRLPVVYNDVMPDLFMKSTSVIVEGRLTQQGVFRADLILVQCPSKYRDAAGPGDQTILDQPEVSAVTR